MMRLGTITILVLATLFFMGASWAAVDLEVSISSSVDSVESGVNYNLYVDYRNASLTRDVQQAKIFITMQEAIRSIS